MLNIAFRIADEQGLALLDLKDLRAILGLVAENAAELQKTYGNVSPATGRHHPARSCWCWKTRAPIRSSASPRSTSKDFMRTDRDGRGIINILAADKLIANPRLYATFLLWLLSELFEELPEVGDLDKPKLVFFFDEAHLLFNDAPKPLLEKIEQVVRLIRSKGVGVYFVTQNPLDVPETVLAQLGNRVQHALRAFTPRDQKAVKAAAETFRPNKNLDTAQVITELGKGEALVSFLEGNGVPSMVERTMIRPPSARLGAITPAERSADHRGEPAARANTTPRSIRNPLTRYCRSAWRPSDRRSRAPGRRGQGGGIARPDRRRARRHLRHQPAARQAAVDRANGDARNHPHGHQPRRRARSRPISASRWAARWAASKAR